MSRNNTKKNNISTSKKKKQGYTRYVSGPFICVFTLFLLSLLGGINLKPAPRIYLKGEIAGKDIAAHRDLLVEDYDSTMRKKNRVAQSQPPVYDLSMKPYERLKQETIRILQKVKDVPQSLANQVRWEIAEEVNEEISLLSVQIWSKPEFYEIFTTKVLPKLKNQYRQGLLADKEVLTEARNGIQVRNLSTGEERLYVDFQDITDIQSLKTAFDVFMQEELNLKLRARKAVFELIDPFLRQNLTYNQETTLSRIDELREAVEPVFYRIKKGEIIVRQGERVTLDQQRKLQALLVNPPNLFRPFHSVGIFIISGFLLFGLYGSTKITTIKKSFLNRDYYLLSTMLLVTGFLAKGLDIAREGFSHGVIRIEGDLFPYCLPVVGMIGLLSMFFPKSIYFVGSLLFAFLATMLSGGDLNLFLFFVLGGLLYTFLLQESKNRTAVLKSVIPLTGGILALWVGINLMNYQGTEWFAAGAGFVLACAVFSLLVVLAFSPIAEHLFGYTSMFKLMELMNLEQPLLQDLMVNAPGTYHHSLIVANLAEAGARRINANSTMVKVAALYHDIGKLKNPGYFIENQFEGKNRHDKLSPSMSSLILISHVKKGVEMAKEHNLGPELTDLIQQHHGTSLISYFYNKAKEKADKSKSDTTIRDEEFCYPGPKPQTKEAGLLLLADIIEASSRTLVDPTPSRIKGHIKTIFSKVFSEGQLDESELTLKDLTQVSEVFHRILTGIFHHRVEYPKNVKVKQNERKGVDTSASQPQHS